MTLALLHRRLAVAMGLASLVALASGAGLTPAVGATAAALVVALFWRAERRGAAWLELAAKVASVVLFALVVRAAFLVRGDILPPSLALLFAILASEALRPLQARNDFRLFALPFALLVAATAYYPGVGFGVGFAVYVVAATLTLTVGHLRRQSERFGIAEPRVGRAFLAATAALSLITLLASAVVFVTFPRLPRNWFAQGRAVGGSVAGFGDEVSLTEFGGSIEPNPEVMFRVEPAAGRMADPLRQYWRGLSFDHFDGRRWSRSRGRFARIGTTAAGPWAQWGRVQEQYRVYGGRVGARVLFARHPVIRVRAESAIRPRFRSNGDLMYDGSDAPVYSVVSGPFQPPEGLLRSAVEEGDRGLGRYLQLPPLDRRIALLADSLTRADTARLDRVRSVERWLREELAYTTDLPRSAREATLEAFLFERRAGHCEYFSTAMVVLLRSAGIPARNVNGFLGGEWRERAGYLAVTGNEAHSWVEVWFPRVGWVPFDPTPPASRQSALASATGSSLSPVLLWLDDLQFRWHRGVLSYDLGRQAELLRGLRGGGEGEEAASGGDGEPLSPARTAALGAIALAGALALAYRRRDRRPAEARLYLDLRRRYARAGFPVRPEDPPLAFLDALRGALAPGVRDAEWIVERYLRARFAAEPLTHPERRELRGRAARVRKSLRGAAPGAGAASGPPSPPP